MRRWQGSVALAAFRGGERSVNGGEGAQHFFEHVAGDLACEAGVVAVDRLNDLLKRARLLTAACWSATWAATSARITMQRPAGFRFGFCCGSCFRAPSGCRAWTQLARYENGHRAVGPDPS